MNAVGKLERDVDVIPENGVSSRFNSETIYDLDSIPARIILLAKCTEAISFGATELTNKVVAAHRELGAGIAKGIIKALNPFENIAGLEAYTLIMDELMQKVLKYPDAGPNAVANLYKREDFERLLTKARFVKFNETVKKDPAIDTALDRLVLELTGLRLASTTTNKQVDEAMALLKGKIQEAIDSPDVLAGRESISRLSNEI